MIPQRDRKETTDQRIKWASGGEDAERPGLRGRQGAVLELLDYYPEAALRLLGQSLEGRNRPYFAAITDKIYPFCRTTQA
jgi:hypothetical protein